jgi:hypothetical protein
MESTTEINLGRGYVAIVDSDIFKRLRLHRFTWRPQVHKRAGKVYAVTYSNGFVIPLHREILNAQPGQVVDHIDGDGLNNRMVNLRYATSKQNRANSQRDRDNQSGLKGVTWAKTSHKWMAQITHEGKRFYLGLFQHKKRAALAHDRAALAIHGEFAGLNYPELKDSLRPKDPR